MVLPSSHDYKDLDLLAFAILMNARRESKVDSNCNTQDGYFALVGELKISQCMEVLPIYFRMPCILTLQNFGLFQRRYPASLFNLTDLSQLQILLHKEETASNMFTAVTQPALCAPFFQVILLLFIIPMLYRYFSALLLMLDGLHVAQSTSEVSSMLYQLHGK